jgi:hypothetical protein
VASAERKKRVTPAAREIENREQQFVEIDQPEQISTKWNEGRGVTSVERRK